MEEPMQLKITQGKWQQVRGKKRPHWSILTLDDLDKHNWKQNLLKIQLQARYKTDKKLGKVKPNQISEDISS
jgi:hypothetical protein